LIRGPSVFWALWQSCRGALFVLEKPFSGIFASVMSEVKVPREVVDSFFFSRYDADFAGVRIET
jgi:hypothetical protein